MKVTSNFSVLSRLVVRFRIVFSISALILSLFCDPRNSNAENPSKIKPKTTPNIVIFDKGFPSKQRAAVLEIANAIRSGSVERISKYTKDGEDPNAIKVFWSGVDELSNLKFRARTWENARNTSEKGFILSDAANGMSSCALIKKGNHFVIGGCVFNDGN